MQVVMLDGLHSCMLAGMDVKMLSNVQLLLDNSEKDIDLNARTYEGRTAFMIACDIRNRDIVQLLVEHSKIKGIDISIGQE